MRGSSQKIKREQLSENMHEKQEPMLVGLQVQPGAKGCRDQRAGRSLGKSCPLKGWKCGSRSGGKDDGAQSRLQAETVLDFCVCFLGQLGRLNKGFQTETSGSILVRKERWQAKGALDSSVPRVLVQHPRGSLTSCVASVVSSPWGHVDCRHPEISCKRIGNLSWT